MIGRIIAVVATSGVAFVAAGVGWRYVCPLFVDLPAGDDLGRLAVREGVAVGLVVVGVGIVVVSLGTLVLVNGVTAGPDGPLVALADVLPIRAVGGLFVAGGLALLCGSLLVPVGTGG